MAFGKHSKSDSHDVLNAGTKSGPGKKLVLTKRVVSCVLKFVEKTFRSFKIVFEK